MGLDVYLWYSGMGEKEQRRWEKRADEILGPVLEKYTTEEVTRKVPMLFDGTEETRTYKRIPEDQKKAWADEAEAALRAEGFVIDRIGNDWVRGKPPLEVGGHFQQNSAIHPDHLFKVGYLRSSYNSGGINSITRELIGMDLYDVFDPKDRYSFAPAWVAARGRAVHVQEKLKQKAEELGGLSAEEIPIYLNSHPNTEKERPHNSQEAMAVFRRQYEGQVGFTLYSSGLGLFMLKHPMRTVALIRGANHVLGTRPSMFAVTRPYNKGLVPLGTPGVAPDDVQVYKVQITNSGDNPLGLPSDRGQVLHAYEVTRSLEPRVEWRNPWDLIRVENPSEQVYQDMKDAPLEQALSYEGHQRLVVAYPGMWYPGGFLMYAFIVGLDEETGVPVGYVIGRPCAAEDKLQDESNLQWYINAYDVVIETIDFVLAKPPAERRKWRLHWSS